jgi:hypothetical protein
MCAHATAFIPPKRSVNLPQPRSFTLIRTIASTVVPVYRLAPVSAIYPAEDLPEKWKAFASKNADWYTVKST